MSPPVAVVSPSIGMPPPVCVRIACVGPHCVCCVLQTKRSITVEVQWGTHGQRVPRSPASFSPKPPISEASVATLLQAKTFSSEPSIGIVRLRVVELKVLLVCLVALLALPAWFVSAA